MTPQQFDEMERFGWWVCGCVKRDRKGRMKAIAYNPPTRKRCGRCRCEQKKRQPPPPAAPTASEAKED